MYHLRLFLHQVTGGAVVQWLKLLVWKVLLWPPSLKETKWFFSAHPKDSILWRASLTERWRARPQTARAQISTPVSGGQCHLIHFTILNLMSYRILNKLPCYRVTLLLQDVLLAQFSLYEHNSGLKPNTSHFDFVTVVIRCVSGASVCLNGGACLLKDEEPDVVQGSFECSCTPGYTGEFCEKREFECPVE